MGLVYLRSLTCISHRSQVNVGRYISPTVDGRNPAPVDMENLSSFTHLQGFIHLRWLFRIFSISMDQWILRVCRKSFTFPPLFLWHPRPKEVVVVASASPARPSLPKKKKLADLIWKIMYTLRGVQQTQKNTPKSNSQVLFPRNLFEESPEQKKNNKIHSYQRLVPKLSLTHHPWGFPTWEVVETWQWKQAGCRAGPQNSARGPGTPWMTYKVGYPKLIKLDTRAYLNDKKNNDKLINPN